MTPRYEALLLTNPAITQDEAKNIESLFERVVKDNKGSMISFEKWGKYRLAFPVNKNDYGIYFLARFETDNKKTVDDLKTLMAVKLNDLVMRDMISALEPKQSLIYNRPQSLEEAPAREIGGFMGDRGDRNERRESSYHASEQSQDLDEVETSDDKE